MESLPQAYQWASDHVAGGQWAVDHLLIVTSAALTLAALGGASYNMWKAGLRILAVLVCSSLALFFAAQTRAHFTRVYPDAAARDALLERVTEQRPWWFKL